jgi:hypothetical protein
MIESLLKISVIFASNNPDFMKQSIAIIAGIILFGIIISTGCKKNEPEQPCDNKGRICITNKLDSTATIRVVQLNQVFDLDKDYMQCLSVTGDNPYTFKVSCNTYYLDTTFMILSCDDLQLLLELP